MMRSCGLFLRSQRSACGCCKNPLGSIILLPDPLLELLQLLLNNCGKIFTSLSNTYNQMACRGQYLQSVSYWHRQITITVVVEALRYQFFLPDLFLAHYFFCTCSRCKIVWQLWEYMRIWPHKSFNVDSYFIKHFHIFLLICRLPIAERYVFFSSTRQAFFVQKSSTYGMMDSAFGLMLPLLSENSGPNCP